MFSKKRGECERFDHKKYFKFSNRFNKHKMIILYFQEQKIQNHLSESEIAMYYYMHCYSFTNYRAITNTQRFNGLLRNQISHLRIMSLYYTIRESPPNRLMAL